MRDYSKAIIMKKKMCIIKIILYHVVTAKPLIRYPTGQYEFRRRLELVYHTYKLPAIISIVERTKQLGYVIVAVWPASTEV